jgi:hypothetical protein
MEKFGNTTVHGDMLSSACSVDRSLRSTLWKLFKQQQEKFTEICPYPEMMPEDLKENFDLFKTLAGYQSLSELNHSTINQASFS